MEHLENDMDDLFQKAGELYPLKTSGSDWEGMLGKLNEDDLGNQKGALKMNPRGLGNKRIWLLLLLLIPISVGSVLYFSNSKSKNSSAAAKLLKQKNNHSDLPLNQIVKSDEKITSRGSNSTNEIKENKSIPQTGSVNRTVKESSRTSATSNNPEYSRASKTKTSFIESEIISDNLAMGETGGNNQKTEVEETPAKKNLSLSVESQLEIILIQGKPLSSNPNKLPYDATTSTEKSKKTDSPKSNKGFYIGLLIGPDLSTVKFQSVKQLGFSLGTNVGYRFSKRVSVETGLLWDKKYYYSSGEYFNTDKLPVQPPPTIKSLQGYCNMYEIPIDLRYDFTVTKNNMFFGKIGFSNYFMKKEDYTYTKPNGYDAGPYSYYNSSNNFLAVLQLSGGYERSIGTNTSFWIEPYFKIPLQGVGLGSMPISSAGFYLGISYSFR
jgi:Outer membrane protein beta-barrel domain